MKFAICNETFQGWDWPSTCEFVAKVGYDGIEIAPFTFREDVRDIAASERREIAGVAKANGLEIVGLHWLLVSPKGLSMTSDNDEVRTETTNYVAALADFCGDIGGTTMVFGSPAQRRIPAGASATVARDRFADAIKLGLDRALERGITICVEPLPPPEADLILTLSEADEMVHRLNHPAAKTIFDVKSASSERLSFETLIKTYCNVITHVHANDANRRGPGFGDTDFAPIISSLRQVKYEGYVSVEVFDYSPDPQTIASQSLEYLKSF